MLGISRHEGYFAQELIDAIIDNLQDDTQSLISCTLVARNWLWRASTYLCRRLHGKFGDGVHVADFLCSINNSSRLSLFAQELILENITLGSQDLDILPDDVQSLLQQLPGLRVLEIKGFTLAPCTSTPSFPHTDTPYRRHTVHTLRVVHVQQLNHLADILRLFASVEELEFKDVRAPEDPSDSMPAEDQPSVDSISLVRSDPGALSSVLRVLSTQVVRLRMDDNIFTSSELAFRCNDALHEVGSQLRSLRIDLFSGSRSMAVPDAALWALNRCSNLRTITVHAQLYFSGDEARLANTLTFTVVCEIIGAACVRAPITLESAWVTFKFQPIYRAMRPVNIPGLRCIDWRYMGTDLSAFSRRRRRVESDHGMFFVVEKNEGGSEITSWLETEIKAAITAELWSEPLSAMRFT